jgi:hypothetical protein
MSRGMLERYSHIWMAAKVQAVQAITLRPELQNSEVPVAEPVARVQVNRISPRKLELAEGFEPPTL